MNSYHSFVPAQSATIGITDRLFTRTQTLETISKVFLNNYMRLHLIQ